jgi:hypothetical protein
MRLPIVLASFTGMTIEIYSNSADFPEQITGLSDVLKSLCFIHLPKTAGISASYLLQSWYGSEVLQIRDWAHFLALSKNPEEWRHYRAVWGHVNPLIRSLYARECVTCTILRDPIQRAFSMLSYMRRFPSFFPTTLGGKISEFSLEELIWTLKCAGRSTTSRPDCSGAVL